MQNRGQSAYASAVCRFFAELHPLSQCRPLPPRSLRCLGRRDTITVYDGLEQTRSRLDGNTDCPENDTRTSPRGTRSSSRPGSIFGKQVRNRRQGRVWIIEGVTLEEKLYAGPLRVPHILELGVEREALEAAHKKGIAPRHDSKYHRLMAWAILRVAKKSNRSRVKSTFFHIEHRNAGHGHPLSPEQVPSRRRKNRHFTSRSSFTEATGTIPFQGATSGLIYDATSELTRRAQPQFARGSRAPIRLSKRPRPTVGQGLDGELKRMKRDTDTGTRIPPVVVPEKGDIREQDLALAVASFSPSVSGLVLGHPIGHDQLPRRSPVREAGRSRDRLPRGRYRRPS